MKKVIYIFTVLSLAFSLCGCGSSGGGEDDPDDPDNPMPGEQLVKSGDGREMSVREVNVTSYVAWKSGYFLFENERLEDILSELARWYNVDVFYQTSSVKDLHFSGYMERYKEIDTILGAITLSTGVRFSIQGTTIVVSK